MINYAVFLEESDSAEQDIASAWQHAARRG